MPLIDEGLPAADFTLHDQRGVKHALNDYAGRPVVLYFYPQDDTSGCTQEACGFRDMFPQFVAVHAAVLGVSPDSIESHLRFSDKHDLPFTLLADEPNADGTPPVCHAYGVWQEKSRDGRKYTGVVRTTYLIDANGQVARRWDNVRVPGHAENVLETARLLVS